jgi:hypothetical protein
MTAQLVWLAKNTIEAGSGNPIIEASSIAICAIYFTNQVRRRYFPCASVPPSLFPPSAAACGCAASRQPGGGAVAGRRTLQERAKPRHPVQVLLTRAARASRLTRARICSEEIAFYKGEKVEERRILQSFQGMLKQIMKVRADP